MSFALTRRKNSVSMRSTALSRRFAKYFLRGRNFDFSDAAFLRRRFAAAGLYADNKKDFISKRDEVLSRLHDTTLNWRNAHSDLCNGRTRNRLIAWFGDSARGGAIIRVHCRFPPANGSLKCAERFCFPSTHLKLLLLFYHNVSGLSRGINIFFFFFFPTMCNRSFYIPYFCRAFRLPRPTP